MEPEKQKLSVEKCRSLLGDEFDDYSDEEIEQLRDWLDMLAEMAVKSFTGNWSEIIPWNYCHFDQKST